MIVVTEELKRRKVKMKDADGNEEVVDVAEELQKKGVVQKRV